MPLIKNEKKLAEILTNNHQISKITGKNERITKFRLIGGGRKTKLKKMCTSCDENLVGAYKCQECDILCQKCYKAHSRLKLTKTHVVTPL